MSNKTNYYVLTFCDNKYRRYKLNTREVKKAIESGWANVPKYFETSGEAKQWWREKGYVLDKREQSGTSVFYIVTEE